MLKVSNLSFAYHESNDDVISQLNFELKRGQHLSVMGASGCGKSTLLELIYGLHDINVGKIYWNEHQVLGPAFHLVPGMPQMKYVSQHFDLMPYITVAENVGKYLSNLNLKYKKNRTEELLKIVELNDYANVKAKLLSGGQMQRVAIAQALAQMPELILLDEPFSHIDSFQKNRLRRNLFNFFAENNITCITATHDKNDVLGFSDEVLVLDNGKLVQHDKTSICYQQPNNIKVANLFDECIELTQEMSLILDTKKQFVYANEWTVNNQKGIEVRLKKEYFLGHAYQYIGTYKDLEIVFFSEEKLNGIVHLSI